MFDLMFIASLCWFFRFSVYHVSCLHARVLLHILVIVYRQTRSSKQAIMLMKAR